MLLVLLNEEERFKEESKWNCDLVFSDVFFFFLPSTSTCTLSRLPTAAAFRSPATKYKRPHYCFDIEVVKPVQKKEI